MADSERQASLIARLQSILDSSVAAGVPGLSAAIYSSNEEREGQIHLLRAGFKDLVAKIPLDEASSFGIGSITKVFVAVVVLQLVQEKKLGLDDRASEILGSGILDEIPNARTARIRDLLSHTGAIVSWEDDAEWIRDGRGERILPWKIWWKDETLQYVRRPSSEGTDTGLEVGKYHYANTNYTILGLVIEHITQNTAENEVRRRILQPLTLARTYFEGFEPPPVGKDRTPRRYHWATDAFHETAGISPHFSDVEDTGLVDATGTNLSVSWVAGGMISTPSNLVEFAIALREGKLLNPALMATLMEWHDADNEKDMGHGVFRLRNAHGAKGATWVGHNGGVLGFTAALWWDIEGTCAVSILANVGSSHAGKVPSNAATVALRTEFLELAAQL